MTETLNARDIAYYRKRFQNRVLSKLAGFFAEEAERTGLTKRQIADRLGKDPGQIAKLLLYPSNITLDTLSDLLLAMGAEADPPAIVRFTDRKQPNYAHDLYARATGAEVVPVAGVGATKVEWTIRTSPSVAAISVAGGSDQHPPGN